MKWVCEVISRVKVMTIIDTVNCIPTNVRRRARPASERAKLPLMTRAGLREVEYHAG